MAKTRSKARKAPHGKPAAKTATKTQHRSLPENSMKKPSRTALFPTPPRTSGQVTPADQPAAPPQETDKYVELLPSTQAPGEDLTTNQGVSSATTRIP